VGWKKLMTIVLSMERRILINIMNPVVYSWSLDDTVIKTSKMLTFYNIISQISTLKVKQFRRVDTQDYVSGTCDSASVLIVVG